MVALLLAALLASLLALAPGCIESTGSRVGDTTRVDSVDGADDTAPEPDPDGAPTDDTGADVSVDTTPDPGGLIVAPQHLDFGVVPRSTTATRTAHLVNGGAAPLAIDGFTFSGHPRYSVVLAGRRYDVSAESSSTGIVLSPPLTIEAGGSIAVDVSYTADGPEAALGSLTFLVADGARQLSLSANVAGPCIGVVPLRVEFGGRAIGVAATIDVAITSCGAEALVIDELRTIEDAGGVFTVSWPGGDLPFTVAPNEALVVAVRYAPTRVAEPGPDGELAVDRGMLRIGSNAFVAELDVPLNGFGVAGGDCPRAIIEVAEGLEVVPGTLLHLDGSGSSSSAGAITGYTWSVQQPGGSVSTFSPSPFVASPTFDANIVGTYVFGLAVTDAFGTRSCAPAEVEVVVSADEAIRVELVWDTPGDPDPTDEGPGSGADLDLHFLHPDAEGRFFDGEWDCYWDNAEPEWGLFGPSDNPRLEHDDDNGPGPEAISLDVPEQGARYEAGAYDYDNDADFGPAFATMRVYVYGVLRDAWEEVELQKKDLWASHTIAWPSGEVTRVLDDDAGPLVIENYLGF